MRSAREFVAEALADHAFEGDHDMALLLVSELATNAVRHAGTTFEVTVESTGREVRIAVIDQDVAHHPEVRRPTVEESSGRGLLIVNEVAARWGADDLGDGTKAVWFTLA